MPVGSILLIIGAVVGAATSAASSGVNAKRTREANEEGLRLANIQRQDKLKLDEANEKMNKWNQRFQKKQLDFQKGEARKNRAERSEQKGYERRQGFFADSINLMNTNPAVRQGFMDTFRRPV